MCAVVPRTKMHAVGVAYRGEERTKAARTEAIKMLYVTEQSFSSTVYLLT